MSEEMNLEEAEEMASEQDLGQDAELDLSLIHISEPTRQ